MGHKTIIQVKNQPNFSDSVINFELIRENSPLRYIFDDEWDVGDYRLHLGGLGRPYSMNSFIREDYIGKLHEMAKIPDDIIEGHINNASDRVSPYWDQYKKLTVEYMKAKRDCVRDLTLAEIVDIERVFDNKY